MAAHFTNNPESETDTPSVINVAAYKFVPLTQLDGMRQWIRELASRTGLKGTVLLSSEGVNLFVAGERSAIDCFLAELQADPPVEGGSAIGELATKESITDYQPFKRMLVKIKREIIAFGIDGIDPCERAAPKLSPNELKAWLDEGRAVTLLDVRNDYEIELGTFAGAEAIGVKHFRHFPQAVDQLPEERKDETIVMFCTGGIRCEKAGLYMQQAGFGDVHQLDGGILNYFEQCGGEHYAGDCFVFDQRVAVDPQLQPTDAPVELAGSQVGWRRLPGETSEPSAADS